MTETTEPRAKYHVPALEKGFEILEELANSSLPMTLTQLANRLARSTNEIYRVLNSLEQLGYIRRDEHTGAYRLSLRLYELAHRHPPVQTLLLAASGPMEALAEALGESCHLSMVRRGKLVVLQQALSPQPVRLSIDVGGRFPLATTVSGRLLLATMRPEERDAILDAEPGYGAADAPARRALEEKLAAIRATGYSMAEHETHVGVRDYAVAIGSPESGLTAALAVAALTPIAGPADGMTILNALNACAAKISEELGIHHES